MLADLTVISGSSLVTLLVLVVLVLLVVLLIKRL
jgi:hypothetical protein